MLSLHFNSATALLLSSVQDFRGGILQGLWCTGDQTIQPQ